MIDLTSQLDAVKSLDALLVLCGEGPDHSRSDHTHHLYSGVQRSEPLSLVITGRSSGLNPVMPDEPDAAVMQRYLLSRGIPEDQMHLETEALDTLGNMVFSRPILDSLLSRYASKRVGLVTDRFHMDRADYLARRVFGTAYDITSLPTQKGSTLTGRLIESAVKNAVRLDLWREGITPGDQAKFERYMQEKHPFHNDNSPLGAYKAGIAFLKMIRGEKAGYPTTTQTKSVQADALK